ncbi:MFS general substrate transporter [Chloropicon primus]|uniref:MFS general substrate transporter n=2 Tax=Chloropicon primus TaxID=1764295 RepID=A0A5B8MV03_9CHLO|nr:MFS general substrate transporter [Chloropicon primus]UPR02677.1 MFS general substrate transporter [Chloropicon primus]|eukprot:QDZ23465.1 MFS general substrate transporter [Chloropicon primus]
MSLESGLMVVRELVGEEDGGRGGRTPPRGDGEIEEWSLGEAGDEDPYHRLGGGGEEERPRGRWAWATGAQHARDDASRAAADTPCPSPPRFGGSWRAAFFDRKGSLRPTDLVDPLLGEREGGRLGGWARLGGEGARRRVSMVFICFIVLVGDGNRGLVLPTLQGYLSKFGGTSSAVGVANAGFSAGRLLAAPVYGYWMDQRNTGEVLLFSMAICAICNLLYTYASYVHVNGFLSPTFMIVASRTMLGVGASVLGVGRAYIAKQTSKAERGPYIAILCALQYAGFTLTAFISMIDFGGIASLSLTKYNLPGFVLTVAYAVGIVVLLTVPNTLFDPEAGHQTNSERRSLGRSKYHNSSQPYLMQLEKSESTESLAREAEAAQETEAMAPGGPAEAAGKGGSSSSLRKLLDVPGIVVIFILLNFTVRAVLATLETLSTYIISYLYTGSTSQKVWRADGAPFRVSITFTVIGVFGLIVFAGVYYLSGHFPDRSTLLLGLGFILAGLGLTLDPHDGEGLDREMSLARFEIGVGMVWGLGYPLSQTVVVSALSKVLSKEQQGIWMGNLASAGSAGRILAPTIAGYVYSSTHSHTGFVPLTSCFVITGLSMLLVAAKWKQLAPSDV